MLDEFTARLSRSGLSLRIVADELGVSHTLLSLVINGRRSPSARLKDSIAKWMATPLKRAVDPDPACAFSRFLDERGPALTNGTVRFYSEKLGPFVLWCEQRQIRDVTTVTTADVSTFLSEIRKGRKRVNGGTKPLSQGGLKLHHQTLMTFFGFVARSYPLPERWQHPVQELKVRPSQAQALAYSSEELARISYFIERERDGVLRLRNRAIVTVLLNTAVRLSELLAMDTTHIAESGLVKIIGKGSKHRVVTVGETGIQQIEAYLTARGDRKGCLWQTSCGTRLTAQGLRSWFARIERRAPDSFQDGVYAHRFRHTAITRLLRARVPLRSVQRYAGHSDPQTTLRYAQALDADEAIAAVDEIG